MAMIGRRNLERCNNVISTCLFRGYGGDLAGNRAGNRAGSWAGLTADGAAASAVGTWEITR